MARSALKEREDYVLEGHDPTIPGVFARERFRTGINYLVTRIDQYPGTFLVGHYGLVADSGTPAGGRRPTSAAGHLAVDDVLVDSMRGRSSTWTRIRLNLRHVPDEIRPAQETPDPDDDPTRAWREAWRKARE